MKDFEFVKGLHPLEGPWTKVDVYFEHGSDPKSLAKLLGDERGRNLEELVVTVDEPNDQLGEVVNAIVASAPASISSLTIRHSEFGPDDSEEQTPALLAETLWQALPNLKSLRLEGHAFFRELAHPTLESLSMRGNSVTESFFYKPPDLPSLRSLTWSLYGCIEGTAYEPSAFELLFTAKGLPALRELDLSNADIDGCVLECHEGALLSQLEVLAIPFADVATLRAAAPKLAGLRELRLGEVWREAGTQLDRILREADYAGLSATLGVPLVFSPRVQGQEG